MNLHPYRTHTCAALRPSDIGKTVRISGWVDRTRDHGQLVFLDLRDHYGVTQCVAEQGQEAFATLTQLKNESVVIVTGEVVARPKETVNPALATGEVEVKITALAVESAAEPLPMMVNAEGDFPESTRLTYRFLDLRREKLHRNIMLRSNVIASIRRRMIAAGFQEFQTPILTASSPEGARDYLVPSRVHPGKFYALPQAPQMFKQLLMVSGFDRYFQIAPCFRDEDARADRSPGEFYQLDIEMSFVTQADVFAAIEPVLRGVFEEFADGKKVDPDFPHIAYDDAMLTYGSDKPDLRNPLKIADVSDIWAGSEFAIFSAVLKSGGVIRAIPAPGCCDKPRSFFDNMIEFAKSHGAKGLAYIGFDTEGAGKGPIAKFLSAENTALLKTRLGLRNGDAVFFSSGTANEAANIAGRVRTHLGEQLNLIDQSVFKFCWVVDFPYFEWNEEEKKIDFSHNPFSMPQGGLAALQQAEGDTEKLLALRAYQYDIVCNGVELSSGAIRNHKPELMIKAFEIAGYSRADVENKFGALFRAFHYGAPPHGGLAPGVDRIVMLLANEPNIREVICFPMNQQAQDLLMHAPNTVTEKQLRELHIQLSPKAKKMLEDAAATSSDAA